MSKLMDRVRGHVSGQRTSGQNTLSLTVECIEHMFGDSGDWSPLAYLIGRSEPAQAREVRRIAGRIVQGYRLTKDDKQPSGLRFVKVKDANQGIDTAKLDMLKTLVDKKKSVQSKDVKEKFASEKAAPKAWDAKAWAARQVKAQPDQLEAMIAALQAQRQAVSVK